MREIGHAEARRLIGMIADRLDPSGEGAAVAVVDRHGERVESSVLGERSRTEGFPLTNFGDPRYVGWGGGVPLVVDGEVIGAIGVSGLPEAADVELARWAAASLGAR